MFFNKKLITNNQTIREFDFYDPKNIYILGDKRENLIKFILENDANWNSDILHKYSFADWLNNFL